MNSLKSILDKKKQEVKQIAGDRKWVKRKETERAERPTSAKVQRQQQPPAAAQAAQPQAEEASTKPALAALSEDQVKRRLRRLGEPATLFAEDHDVRAARLAHAEATLVVRDEDAGAGERSNVLLDIRREDRRRAKRATEATTSAAAGRTPQSEQPTGPQRPTSAAAGVAGGEAADEGVEEESETMRQFREAAARLAAKRELAAMTADQRVVRALRGWMDEWRADLDGRPVEAVHTTVGLQATNGFRQTERAFAVLYERLESGAVHPEIRSCLALIVEALQQRNYQRANEVYLQLSIGNQAWPIGVTSIGIHDRTAREKLSYYSNEKSQAHIMNDEATRKYLHGLSRLIKAVQGLRPTDPSRSVNFNAVEHAGLGARCGAQKSNLLQLKAAGDTWQGQGLAPAPHLLGADGKVSVPATWGSKMREHARAAEGAEAAGGGGKAT